MNACRWIDNICEQHNLNKYLISKYRDVDFLKIV